jgi:beta-galactosidase beta subunit
VKAEEETWQENRDGVQATEEESTNQARPASDGDAVFAEMEEETQKEREGASDQLHDREA